MTAIQLFGKHELDYVTRLPDSEKVGVSTNHYDTKRDIATDVRVSMFFDSLEDAARFALDMLTKVVAEMAAKEAQDAQAR